jgi:hypothetical protein
MDQPAVPAKWREVAKVFDESVWQTHKMIAVGRVSITTAHEFNNLMQGVVASLELTRKLINGGRASETGPLIAKAITAAQHAALLNQRVARFARPQPVTPKVLSINAVVADIEEMLRFSLAPAYKLEVAPAADLWPVYCDAGQATIALVDMVLALRDAMPGGGAIAIATRNELLASDRFASQPAHGTRHAVCIAVTATTAASRAADSTSTWTPASSGAASQPSQALVMVDQFAHIYGGELRLRDHAAEQSVTELYLPRFVAG